MYIKGIFIVKSHNPVLAIVTFVLSGILFYFSTGFHQCWPLLWLAPIAPLVYAYYYSYSSSFWVGFFAFVLGKLNMLAYLGTGMPAVLIITPIILESLIFAIVLVVNKWTVEHLRNWLSILLFPALWTSYEFLFSLISPAGALTSLAYTQMGFQNFIQLSSLTGIWGITFVMLLFSSGISYALYSRQTSQRILSLLIAIAIPLLCMIYGYHRLHAEYKPLQTVKLGLVAIKTSHRIFDEGSMALSQSYVGLIHEAAEQGAQLVILPEKFIRINKVNYEKIIPIFQQAAAENHVTLVVGMGILDQKSVNAAIVIDPNGKIMGSYYKHHLLPGLENQFTPGNTFFIHRGEASWGVGICKDMDFSTLGQAYSKENVQLLLVPALDFNIDAWHHARVAIMRGIENGFAVARSANQGFLSVTDQFGCLIGIKSSFENTDNVLVTSLALYPIQTLYGRWGNWFAWFVFGLLFSLITVIIFRTQKIR